MKTPPAPLYAITFGLFLVISGFAAAESPASMPDREGKRLKFTSKIHIPVQPASEVTSLPPFGYELVFEDEFNGDTIDTQKWGFGRDSKILSTQQRNYRDVF